MKILFYLPFENTVGADRWIYEGWRSGFINNGHIFDIVTVFENLLEKTLKCKPDILFITNFIDLNIYGNDLKTIKNKGIKVFLVVDWPLKDNWAEIIKNNDLADVYFGEREPESMIEFEKNTRRKYILIPNAADKVIHFPVNPVNKYKYDIVYLGAYLPKKKKMFEEILFPLIKKYNVGLFGPCWTIKDNVLRAIQKVARKIHLKHISEAVNKMRITIPIEEERALYSSAKICLNFHEREEDGSQPHYIVNQRTYKIAACGGFQICDYVPAIRKYFSEDEVVMANDPDDWFKKIDYYFNNETERSRIKNNAAKTAENMHTYRNRVLQVIEIYNGLKKG